MEIRDVGTIVGRAFFNPMVFFDNFMFSDDDGRSSEEVYKVKWARDDAMAFI